MSPQAQRIAIAEACGWRMGTETVEHIDGFQWTETRKFWTSPTRKIYSLPDYLGDLNAMHEAEKAMSVDDRNRYIDTLGTTYHDSWEFCTATASQRAKAFLRAIGKWENS